jgi:hypothetical protein
MDMEERKKLLLLYGKAGSLFKEAVRRFPATMLKFKPSDHQWSIHEIIIHITDSEINSYIRCRCFIAEPGKTIMAYDQDIWAKKLQYHERSISDAIELFVGLRNASMELIRNLPPQTWNNTIVHPEQGIITMDDWLRTYTEHVPLHIRQMERVYETWKAGKNE